jgi:asparagine N-glycosylation enzyme membrane subunit Stt3
MDNIETSKRDSNILNFFKSKYLIYIALIILIILGTYIRYLPLTDHNGQPGLWDITTNDYTLGPDLDPFLFLRYAKMIESNGSIDALDTMRYVPTGYDTTTELTLVPWMIYLTHKTINTITSIDYNIEYAADLLPVIMFAFTILFFFLFVKEVFFRKNEQNHLYAGAIAIIATIFLIIAPSFLGRTIAGIPEKESVGFCLMFLSLWLFLKSWKEDDHFIKSLIYSILAGIATGLMGLAWGGLIFLTVSIPFAIGFAFILNKLKRVNYIGFTLWLLSMMSILIFFSNRYTIKQFILSIPLSLGLLLIAIMCIHIMLQKFRIYSKLKEKYSTLKLWNIPENIISIVLALILILIGVTIILGPSFLINTFNAISQSLFNPSAGGRWFTTVAENQQPYFTQWSGTLGTAIFYMFVIGSVFFIRKMFNVLSSKDNTILTSSYLFLLIGIIYSRYAPHPSLFDGENLISKALYIISIVVFIGVLIYYYIKYNKEKINIFKDIDFGEILLLIFFLFTLLAARSGVRLIMVLAIVAPIFIAFIIIDLTRSFKDSTDTTKKMFIGISILSLLLLSVMSGYSYYNVTKNQAYSYTPYYYTYQWQQAMDWVRDNTPTNAVFEHWWDYGYWVQSMGERATVTDGGNSNVWWNYLTGRFILTGNNQQDALDFSYAHNVSYLLIDSSDIGKYGAFSQIGSDENLDRFSAGPALMNSDPKTLLETRNGTITVYQGASYLDEDIFYNGTVIFKENGAVLGTRLEMSNGKYLQPEGIFYNSGMQVSIPLRYVYYNKTLTDFGSGINATIYVIQSITQVGQGLSVDQTGSAIYLSPRVMRGFLGQVYLLNDPFNNFPAFKVAHSQPDFILQQVAAQGLVLDEFVQYNGIRGPIKIWEITYTGKEKIMKDSLLALPPDYITWKF